MHFIQLVAPAPTPTDPCAMAKIELRHLRTLVALRDTGTLVDAADRLCLTQSRSNATAVSTG